jgi:hypothetical protein
MEYVEGDSLHRLLTRRGALPPLQVARVGRDVARGMHAVHKHGLLHRDLKPANLVVTPAGVVKIIDFGIAKDVYRTGLTEADQFVGSAAYMAPERWDQRQEDERCDVFSLGVVLYELLVGKLPFPASEPVELMQTITGGRYQRPRERVQGLPAGLDHVLIQLLEPNPAYRYRTMHEVAEDLERILCGAQPEVPSLIGGPGSFPLVDKSQVAVGSDPACELTLHAATVAAEHALIRRQGGGYVLRDLRSEAGTFVGGEPVTRARPLVDGERVRFGAVEFVFVNPRERPASATFPLEVERLALPDPAPWALADLEDPRTALHLLEELCGDPWLEGQMDRRLTALYGASVAQEVGTLRRARRDQALPWIRTRLCAITGISSAEPDLQGWLAWWDDACVTHPLQVGLSGVARSTRLDVTNGRVPGVSLDDVACGLVGRDPRCHLRIPQSSVDRLQALVVRTHRRLLLRARGRRPVLLNGRQATLSFLAPGDVVSFGGVEVQLQAHYLPGVETGPTPIDALSFEALVALRHPGVSHALVLFVEARERGGQAVAEVASLFPDDPTKASAAKVALETRLTKRASGAEDLLTMLLGVTGSSSAEWRSALERRAGLMPQVIPAGLLA